MEMETYMLLPAQIRGKLQSLEELEAGTAEADGPNPEE